MTGGTGCSTSTRSASSVRSRGRSPLAHALDRVTGGATGIEFRAYDGSRAGPRDAPIRVDVRSPLAMRYLVQARNDLGLARAYVSGELEVEGDLHEALRRLWRVNEGNVPWRERLQVLRSAGLGSLWPAEPPPEEARLRGRRHGRRRSAVAASHHYDVSNRFYEWILGPSMAYTCALYPEPDATLEEAQFAKHDVVCRRLGLRPGMRLLDVGCGWGGMVLHAVRHYGVTALGVTLAHRQVEWAQRAIAEEGLAGRAEVRRLDYRDVPDGELLGPGLIVSTMHDAGFEFRHEENLREHYARTLTAWEDNLEAHWAEAVGEVGETRARVWRLYLAGSRVSFEDRWIELHQALGVRTEDGDAGMPLRAEWPAEAADRVQGAL